ncbi:TPA: hypothetical protein IUD81_002634 [Enterococcus faecalis]|nr:hypothetical protein [Enterococcus faecalis]
MKEIYWKNLTKLLNSMEEKGWYVTGFSFNYKRNEFVSIISRAPEDIKYSRCPLNITSCMTIYKNRDLENPLICYTADRWIHVNVPDFYRFFELEGKNDVPFKLIIQRFIKYLDGYIDPVFRKKQTKQIEKCILNYLSVSDSTSPNRIYCFSVGHSRCRKDGTPGKRSTFNSEKTRRLRSKLYEKYGKYTELSFSYSEDPNKEKSDWEIIRNFENNETRKNNRQE